MPSFRGGQNRQSKALKELAGTDRKPRKRLRSTPGARAPRCPRGLSAGAAALWKSLAGDLAARGLLERIDVLLLTEVCRTLARADEVRQVIERDGPMVKSGSRRVKHPLLQVERDLLQRGWSLAGRLGLSPADRVRMNVGQPAAPTTVIYESQTGVRTIIYPELEAILSEPEAEPSLSEEGDDEHRADETTE
jgi:P27 family predicted phage terminase small subunit